VIRLRSGASTTTTEAKHATEPSRKRRRVDENGSNSSSSSPVMDESLEDDDDSKMPQAEHIEFRRMPVSSAVLATHSPVFKTMLSGGMREAHEKEFDVDVSTEREAHAVQNMIRFMYTANMADNAETADLFLLMQVADQYDVPALVMACVQLACSAGFAMTSATAVRILRECEPWMLISRHAEFMQVIQRARHHLFTVVQLCAAMADRDPSTADEQKMLEAYYALPLDVVATAMANDKLVVPSENHVYVAASRWWCHRACKQSTDDPMPLLTSVRLENLSPAFFAMYVMDDEAGAFLGDKSIAPDKQLAVAQRIQQAASLHMAMCRSPAAADEVRLLAGLSQRVSYRFGSNTHTIDWTVQLADIKDSESCDIWKCTRSKPCDVTGFRLAACIEPSRKVKQAGNARFVQPCIIYDREWMQAGTRSMMIASVGVSVTFFARNIETGAVVEIACETLLRLYMQRKGANSRMGLDPNKKMPWASLVYGQSPYVRQDNTMDLRVEIDVRDRAWWDDDECNDEE
jgi:hypothetical protein